MLVVCRQVDQVFEVAKGRDMSAIFVDRVAYIEGEPNPVLNFSNVHHYAKNYAAGSQWTIGPA